MERQATYLKKDILKAQELAKLINSSFAPLNG